MEVGNLEEAAERPIGVMDEEGLNMNDTMDIKAFDAPVLDERPWAVFSACRAADPGMFFASTRDDERAALVICETCSVKDDCLDFALDSKERFGVWGGTTERDRKKLLRAS